MDVRENGAFPYLWWLGLKMDFGYSLRDYAKTTEKND